MAPYRPSASSTSGEDSSHPSTVAICSGESAEEGLQYICLTACSAEGPNSKCLRQAMSEERSDGGHNLDVGLWSTLDDHLLEKIIARLPFKSFFRVSSSLSKTWRLRVQYPSFQREIHNSSSSWESYSPVYMNCKKELVGYESRSKRWHRLPTHSYLPKSLESWRWHLMAGAGSLLCWTSLLQNLDFDGDSEKVFVTNPLTRSWKQLPLRPEMHFRRFVYIDFVYIDLEGTKAYKVILGTLTKLKTPQRGKASICVQIFDSTDESWTMEIYTSTGTNLYGHYFESTFMNGVLYVLDGPYYRRGYEFTLISLDVKKKVWSEIPLRLQVIDEDPRPRDQLLINVFHAMIFVCGSHVMMAIHYGCRVRNMGFAVHGNIRHIFSMFKLDVERGFAFEVSRAPRDLLGLMFPSQRLSGVAAHGDCIYISETYMSNGYEPPVLVYNVGTRQWHQVPFELNRSPPLREMTRISYSPGLNPLLDV